MNRTRSRREVLGLGIAALAAACGPPRASGPAVAKHAHADALAAVEARIGGRVGVFALDTGSGRTLAHRPDERFAMCSTFKWVLAARVLARVDRGELALGDRIRYGERDLLDHAPAARAHLAEGSMTVDALAEAAVTVSDNTAANLLLAKTGGPAGFTAFVRGLGDDVTRLDHDEPDLNDNPPGAVHDTTSPRAMVSLMRSVLCGDVLAPASRERLLGWLRACETGKKRLRAGFPADWTAGDKTGTGGPGTVNDLAMAWPPGRPPILVAAYLSDGAADFDILDGAHAEIAGAVARELTGT